MINILISVNENYLEKAKTMLFSTAKSTKESITVYLLNHGLSEKDVSTLQEYLKKKCKIALEVISIPETALDHMPLGNLNFSIEMYYRIIAQFLLPKSLDRILWLDADIVILKDIAPFYRQDFCEKKYVACADAAGDSAWVKNVKEKLQLPSEHIYFNSGVLLINLEILRKETKLDEILGKSNELRDRLTYPDQDILNTLYAHDVLYADWKRFNYQLLGKGKIPKSERKQIVVLHYAGQKKPWQHQNISASSKYYWKIRVQQGHLLEACGVYARRIKDLTVSYFTALKELFV